MKIDFSLLNYNFMKKPLLVGGMAMEYYGLRKAGRDIDLIVAQEDHSALNKLFPDHIKDLYGDIGICEFDFEIWNQICTFDYDYLRENAIEEENCLVISLEKLLFMKAMGMEIQKYHDDMELIVKLILDKAYGKA